MNINFKIALAGSQEPLFPELEGRIIEKAKVTHACILENGTKNGHPALALFLELQDGSLICAQLTMGVIHTLSAGFAALGEPEDN